MEELVREFLQDYGVLAVFALLMLSGVGIALGEEMVTIPAGVFIATGDLRFWPTLLAAYVAIVAADAMWFGICRHFGTRLLRMPWLRRLVHPRRLLQVKHQLDRRGVWLIVMARFIPSSRSSVITVSGVMHSPFPPFIAATAACVAITVPLQLGLGYLIGQGIGDRPLADLLISLVGILALIVAVTMVVSWWSRHRASKRRPPRAKAAWLRRLRHRDDGKKSDGEHAAV